jgi:hypothetical protein
MFQQMNFMVHDVLEDLQYILQDITTEGSLQNGKITARFNIVGTWYKPVGAVEPIEAEKNINVIGITIYHIKEGKCSEVWSISCTSAYPGWSKAWTDLFTRK